MDTIAITQPKPNGTALARRLGMLASLAAIAASTQPWTTVAFPRLWGADDGVAGLQTETGLVVVLASVLALLLPSLEGGDRQGRRALATGSVLVAALAFLAALWELVVGPAALRGVSTTHTGYYYLSLAAAGTAALLAWRRWVRYSSSGPPT